MSTPTGHDRLAPDTDGAAGPAVCIGPRLAMYRRRRGMKVSALARAVGVSASLISQIERGQSRPSVSTLLALAETLGVPMDAFFRGPHDGDGAIGAHADGDGDRDAHADGDGARGGHADGDAGAPPERADLRLGRRADRRLVRRAERAAIDIEGGVRWERLTPRQLAEVEFMELVYSPGAESHATQYRHPGMEMVLVLEGRLEISVAFERYELGPGDSLCFPSTTPHRYVNPTEDTTRAVTVILPDAGSPEPPTTNRRP